MSGSLRIPNRTASLLRSSPAGAEISGTITEIGTGSALRRKITIADHPPPTSAETSATIDIARLHCSPPSAAGRKQVSDVAPLDSRQFHVPNVPVPTGTSGSRRVGALVGAATRSPWVPTSTPHMLANFCLVTSCRDCVRASRGLSWAVVCCHGRSWGAHLWALRLQVGGGQQRSLAGGGSPSDAR